MYFCEYSWLSLYRPRLSRITAYLEVKIWSLPELENLTTCKKYCGKEEEAISPLFHNIFNISLTSRVPLHIYLLDVVNQISVSSILQVWYVEVRIFRSIEGSPLEFEITRVHCICKVSFMSWVITVAKKSVDSSLHLKVWWTQILPDSYQSLENELKKTRTA